MNSRDEHGMTQLSLAAQNGHETVVRLLLEREDVEVNSREDKGGVTPLSWAACNGHEAAVRLLLERDDIDVNCRESGGRDTVVMGCL